MTWFTGVEAVVYSAVQYIPTIGFLYSYIRAYVAHNEGDDKRVAQSLANFGEAAIRDVLLSAEVGEPVPVVLFHTMAEALTNETINQLFEDTTGTPRIKGPEGLDRSRGHLIFGGSEAKSKTEAERFFTDQAIGLHQFHGAIFTGILTHPEFAPNGEKIELSLPQGFVENAPCHFMWKWTRDASGVTNRPEFTFGRLRITEGTQGSPTRFGLNSRTGVNWQGYDFWGDINSISTLKVYTTAGQEIAMTRKPNT